MNSARGPGASDDSARRDSSVKSAMGTWIQEIAPYGILTTDRDLRIISWNEWLAGHSGLSAAAVTGRLLVEVFPDLQGRRLYDRYARALAGEVSVLSTALHRYLLALPSTLSDSTQPNMLQTARVAPLREGDAVVGTITIIEDVSQREFQAGILHRQQELDRLLSTALGRLLQSNDPAGEVAMIFATFSPTLGLDAFVTYFLSADEASLRLNAAAGISPKQREAIGLLPLNDDDRKAVRAGHAPTSATLGRHAESLLSMGLNGCCSLPLAVGNRFIGLVSFASYERSVIPIADVNILARVADYVAIALDRTTRERDTLAASRAKDDFLAALSHELRTPLNPVLLVASDAAENKDYPPDAREAFRVIEKNVLLEARLIDDLLDLTRIEHGKLSLELQRLDIHSVLTDALKTVKADVEENGLSLCVQLGAERHSASGDAARLQQVFWNVVKNAVKFTMSGGRIWVTTSFDPAANEIVVEVRDTGIGMDPEEVARVFNAFAQGDHAFRGRSHRFGGLGLGLAISRKIVDLHGGRIVALSDGKEKGSTFTINLPLDPSPLTTVSSAAGSRSEGIDLPIDGLSLGPADRKILLVEDHEPTRISLERLLQRRGYRVVAVATSGDAVHEAAKCGFDLVLSDIGLPDGDGFSLMRILHERHGLRGIALTGYGMEEDLARSSDAGFFAHLTKPISAQILDRTLGNAFSGDGG